VGVIILSARAEEQEGRVPGAAAGVSGRSGVCRSRKLREGRSL